MKNQYFGDINDYRKYGLLRILVDGGKLRTAICWMLTGSDGRTDGKFTRYLEDPKRWRSYDPLLFDDLRVCLHEKRERSVELAKQLNLIPGAIYFSTTLTDEPSQRKNYFATLNHMAEGSELLFFDQDNGIEVRSISYGTRNSSKYIYWRELLATYNAGHDILIYQHFPRVKRNDFIATMFREICNRLDVKEVMFYHTTNVLFILIPQENHVNYFSRTASIVERVWGNEIKFSVLKNPG